MKHRLNGVGVMTIDAQLILALAALLSSLTGLVAAFRRKA